MPSAGFEYTYPALKRPETNAFDRTATRIGSMAPISAVHDGPNSNYALQQKVFASFYNQPFRIFHAFLQ
jgi:hypothetical protein